MVHRSLFSTSLYLLVSGDLFDDDVVPPAQPHVELKGVTWVAVDGVVECQDVSDIIMKEVDQGNPVPVVTVATLTTVGFECQHVGPAGDRSVDDQVKSDPEERTPGLSDGQESLSVDLPLVGNTLPDQVLVAGICRQS